MLNVLETQNAEHTEQKTPQGWAVATASLPSHAHCPCAMQVEFPSSQLESSTIWVVTAANRLAGSSGAGSRRLASDGALLLPYNAWLSCVSSSTQLHCSQRPRPRLSVLYAWLCQAD